MNIYFCDKAEISYIKIVRKKPQKMRKIVMRAAMCRGRKLRTMQPGLQEKSRRCSLAA